jgi:type IV secretory pathway VirB9-like protein
MEERSHTNMTIVTNIRAYQFDLRSSDSNAVYGSEELTYVMRFYYPEEGGAPPTAYTPSYGNFAPNPAYATQQAAPTAPVQAAALPNPQFAPQPVNYSPAPTYNQGYAPQPGYAIQPNYSPAPAYNQAYAPPVPAYNSPPNYAPPAAPNYSFTPAPVAAIAPPPPPVSVAPLSPLQPIAAPQASPQAPTVNSGSFNYRYTYSGPNDFAPVKIFDDGKVTYFKFRDNSQLPKFSSVNARGQETAMTYQVNADGLVVVKTLAPRFNLLRNGAKVVVYNEAQG